MHRAVESLGGGILGFVVGSILCAPLIAHVFGPTTVTWDATACPPGVYTITSTATSLTDSRSFTAVTQHIRLPKPSIVQDFGDLPVGQYQVSAVARDARGRTFPSSTQTVNGQGRSRGRQVDRSNVVSQPYRPSARTSTSSATAKSVVATPPPAAAPAASTTAFDRSVRDIGVQNLFDSLGWWKSIAVLDSDEDGAIDVVRIEWITGEVLFVSIR